MYILSKYPESLFAKTSFLLVYPHYIPINPHPKPPLFLVKSLFFMAFLRHISQLPPVFSGNGGFSRRPAQLSALSSAHSVRTWAGAKSCWEMRISPTKTAF